MSDNTMRKRGDRARRTIALTSVTGVGAAVAIGVAVTRSDDSSRVERVAERTPVPAEPAPANPALAEPAAEDDLRVSTRS